MKKQIVLEENQLIEMVNESAKRVLRGLMTEANWYDNLNPFNWFSGGGSDSDSDDGGGSGYYSDSGDVNDVSDVSDYDIAKAFSGNQDALYFIQQVGLDNIKKLYKANPNAVQAMAQNPTMLFQLVGRPDVVEQMASNPTFMQQLATNKNIQNAFLTNGPEQTMAFFSNENMTQLMQNPSIDPSVKYSIYQMMNGSAPIDPNVMQQIMTQYGGAVAGGPTQYSGEQAALYLQGIQQVDQQIADIQAQLQKNPNDVGLQGTLQRLQQQKEGLYLPYLRGYSDNLNNEYNNLYQKMLSNPAFNTPDNMMKLQQLGAQLDACSSYSQYMTPTTGTTQSTPGVGLSNGMVSAAGNVVSNAVANAAVRANNVVNRQQQQAAVRQQPRQQVQPRQQAQPRTNAYSGRQAAATPAATPAAPADTANTTMVQSATVTPQAPSTTNRVTTYSGQQPNTNGTQTQPQAGANGTTYASQQVRTNPGLQNNTLGNRVAGTNFTPNQQNLNLTGVKVPAQQQQPAQQPVQQQYAQYQPPKR